MSSRNSLRGTTKPQATQQAAGVVGWADSRLWAHWGSSAAEERKHWPCCCLELPKERNQPRSKCHQYCIHWFFGWLFLALHCLGPSYHFFFPAPKVKCEEAARSLLRATFLRSRAEGRASPSPPAWWPTALTFRARCQPYLLTQAFANKGSSHCTALSFEDASSFAYFLLLSNIWHLNTWIQRMEGQQSWCRNIRLLYSYPTFFPTTDSDNLKHEKRFCTACSVPRNSTLGFENCVFPFCLLFWKPENSLPKQHTRVNAL